MTWFHNRRDNRVDDLSGIADDVWAERTEQQESASTKDALVNDSAAAREPYAHNVGPGY
jgi:hypothetical protein